MESSVVRITPISPPPPVRFEEFDGLTRILFTRRNKTCRANFQATGVDKMMAENWKRWKEERKAQDSSMVGYVLQAPLIHAKLNNQDIDEGEFTAKAAIEEILKETEFSDVRPAKMSVDDLLK